MMLRQSFDLDLLAIELAAEQGQAWHEMGDFPGYTRNIWRESARVEVMRRMPGAMIEAPPPVLRRPRGLAGAPALKQRL